MEEIYQTFAGSHNGISYSTIIIFGAFIFLLLLTFLGQGGRVSEVLRKSSFFATMLLFIQGVLGVMMEYYSPAFIVVLALSAALVFEYAYPWSKIFG